LHVQEHLVAVTLDVAVEVVPDVGVHAQLVEELEC
jgi:hypothetical protein